MVRGVTVLTGPYAMAAALVVLAGAPKVVRPHGAARALASVRLPSGRPLVRVLGAGEVVVGLAALTVGGRIPAVLLAVSYGGFAGFVLLALRRGGTVGSCGCFGRPDTPPTRLHVALNVAAAAVAAPVAVDPGPRVVDALRDQPLAGAPFVALTALATWFAFLALARLPQLARAAR